MENISDPMVSLNYLDLASFAGLSLSKIPEHLHLGSGLMHVDSYYAATDCNINEGAIADTKVMAGIFGFTGKSAKYTMENVIVTEPGLEFIFRYKKFYSTQVNSLTNYKGIRQGLMSFDALKRAGKAAENRFSDVSARYL